jgi:hypothetical protein
MYEFENVPIRDVYISRYVASWIKSGGDFTHRRNQAKFKDWLRSLYSDGEKLTEDEIQRIWYFATNGKIELEYSAEKFISSHEEV